jgi:hypothetical protein
MDDEREPVDAGEFVYRRVHRNHFQAHMPTPVQVSAFRPTDHDDTGISVFRANFVQPMETLALLPEDKRANYYVVRLAVADLRSLGLTVKPDPVPEGPLGHAIVPELNSQTYRNDKDRLKEVQRELAKLASQGIVYRPAE